MLHKVFIIGFHITAPFQSPQETVKGGTAKSAALCSFPDTSGQLGPMSIGTVTIMPVGFFDGLHIKNVMKLRNHTLNIIGTETAVLHNPNDITTAGIVAPLLIKQYF
jgi:hypothetical protein